MPKVNGPLYSLGASGLVGERLVFSQRKTGQQARFQRAQKDVITASRIIQRDKYKLAVDCWNNLDDVIKEIFDKIVTNLNLKYTGYNKFVKDYLNDEIIGCDESIYGYRNYGIFIYGKS